MKLAFEKYVGAGNDFIFMDYESLSGVDLTDLSQMLCHRQQSIGADGLAAVETLSLDNAEFKWHFFNNDGSSAEMCGNAARCFFQYISEKFGKTAGTVETLAGKVSGKLVDDRVSVSWLLTTEQIVPLEIELADKKKINGSFINTGVPHFVVLNSYGQLSEEDCLAVQEHPQFGPAQTNVTLLDITDDGKFLTKSFERGVKDFTLACGTGVIASAFVLQQLQKSETYILQAPGGVLDVKIDGANVELIGPAEKTFNGEVEIS